MRVRDDGRGCLAVILWGAGMLGLGCGFGGKQTDVAEGSAETTEGAATETGDDPASSEGAGSNESSDESSPWDADPTDCTEAVGVDASFTVEDDHWPGADEFEVAFDVACEIVEMGEDTVDAIDVTLECDLDGTRRTVDIAMAYASPPTPDGQGLAPTFGVGQAVRFRHSGVRDAGGLFVEAGGTPRSHLVLEEFSIHAEDGTLLMAGFDAWDLRPEIHAPVEISEEANHCGDAELVGDTESLPLLMRFTLDATTIEIVGGHVGLLDPVGNGQQRLAIAVQVAHAFGCCHSDRQYEMTLVDVAQGGG